MLSNVIVFIVDSLFSCVVDSNAHFSSLFSPSLKKKVQPTVWLCFRCVIATMIPLISRAEDFFRSSTINLHHRSCAERERRGNMVVDVGLKSKGKWGERTAERWVSRKRRDVDLFKNESSWITRKMVFFSLSEMLKRFWRHNKKWEELLRNNKNRST